MDLGDWFVYRLHENKSNAANAWKFQAKKCEIDQKVICNDRSTVSGTFKLQLSNMAGVTMIGDCWYVKKLNKARKVAVTNDPLFQCYV